MTTNGEPLQAEEPLDSPTRLIIADDHVLIRQGLKTMLSWQPDVEVIGEAKNGLEALRLCRRLLPDVVLMDVRMPEMDGLEATRRLKQELPQISVLLITSFEDPEHLFEALKAGCAGYVLKDAEQDELLDAVRKVVDGESLLDPQLATRLLRRMASDAQNKERAEEAPKTTSPAGSAPLLEPLTPRESEVLQLLAKGQTNRQIAGTLLISLGTIKLYVRNIIAKLGVSDRTQAAVRAVQLGLVTDQEGE